jgi:hypothetical protein
MPIIFWIARKRSALPTVQWSAQERSGVLLKRSWQGSLKFVVLDAD